MIAPAGMDQLIGEWAAVGQMEVDGQAIHITGHTTIERLGEFVVLHTTVQPPEFPDSISIIGGGPEGEPAPMHYFDERGVQRLYLSSVADGRWTIQIAHETWRESPGSTSATSANSPPMARRSPAPGGAASARPATSGRWTSASTTRAR